MNYLAFTHVRLGEIPRADPERFPPRSIGNVALRAEVNVSLPNSVKHRESAALTSNIDDRAFAALPHHVRGSLAPHQQPVAADVLESHSNRHPLVSARIVAGERRILGESRFARAKQKVSGAGILERACQDCRRDGQELGKPDFFSDRVPRAPPCA